jgi:hypothetical protein
VFDLDACNLWAQLKPCLLYENEKISESPDLVHYEMVVMLTEHSLFAKRGMIKAKLAISKGVNNSLMDLRNVSLDLECGGQRPSKAFGRQQTRDFEMETSILTPMNH